MFYFNEHLRLKATVGHHSTGGFGISSTIDVLLVESDPDAAAAFREILDAVPSGSFSMDRAGSLQEALQKLSEMDFHVIVSDLDLPDSSGNDTVQEICRRAVRTPLVVLTAIDDEGMELKALKAGAQDYLVKGRVDPGTLMRSIRHSIERKHLDWQLRKTRRRLRILHDTASKLEGCSKLKNAYRLAVESAGSLLPGTVSRILARKNGSFTVLAASPQLTHQAGSGSALDFGLAGMTFTEKRTFQFSSREDIPVAGPEGGEFASGVSIPVGSGAVFQCLSREPHAFSGDETSMLEMLAGHLLETMDRITLERKLRTLAIHDPLTGVLNRNFFPIALNREKRRAERYKSSIGFLMVDIDNFKEINDRFGHITGDRVLRAVADFLSVSVRESDYLIRYGGDEFIMILVETGSSAAVVRERILNNDSLLAEKTVKLTGRPVTISVGHSHWDPEGGVSIREALSEADRRMYQHKQSK
ncbi:MAG: diguanylate cyclase [Candidatus Aegiribacteria sp.]